MKVTKRILSILLVVVMTLSVVPVSMMSEIGIEAEAANYKTVKLDVPYYCMRHKNGCAIASISMIEAYSNGIVGENVEEVYDAVYKANNSDKNIWIQNWTKMGYSYKSITKGISDSTLSTIYNELKNDRPVLIKKNDYKTVDGEKTATNMHYSVIYGYNGSTSKLDKSGFLVLNTMHTGTSSSKYIYGTHSSSYSGVKTNLSKWSTCSHYQIYLKAANKIKIDIAALNFASNLDGVKLSSTDAKKVFSADIYINGKKVANDVSDYNSKFKNGTTYEIKDIKARTGYKYIGLSEGALSGKLGTKKVNVNLKFITTAISKATVSTANKKYTGSSISASSMITVKIGDKTLKNGTDYTLSPSSVKAIGEYSIKITGKGTYSGSKTVKVTVYPKTPTLETYKYDSSSKSIKLSWVKVADCTKQQIQISTSPDFPSNKSETFTVSKSTGSQSISKFKINNASTAIKTNSTYYVRMRAYKTVSDKNIYGQWGSTKTVSTGNATYKISYNANGGSGSMSAFTVSKDKDFTLTKNTFTRSGYTFNGWNVKRNSDSCWYVAGQGWLSESTISSKGYTKKIYADSSKLTFDGSWYSPNGKAISSSESFTFYAVWKANPSGESVTWTFSDVSNLSQTDAQIKGRATFTKKMSFTKCGFSLGTSSSNLTKCSKYDTISYNLTYLDVWFLMSKYGQTLKPGTTYYYTLYVVANGKEYTSPVKSFKTVVASTGYKMSFNANGGIGSMATFYVNKDKSFAITSNSFTRSGYTLTGWNVRRNSDNCWYVTGQGWVSESTISSKKYTKRLYADCEKLSFSGSWYSPNGKAISSSESFTFYAVWHSNPTTKSIKWTFSDVSSLSKTDAQIKGRATFNEKMKFTKCGFYLGTSSSNLTKCSKYDTISYNLTYLDVWFLMSKYNQSLKSGTTYYYKLYVVADGKEYTSPIRMFTTK